MARKVSKLPKQRTKAGTHKRPGKPAGKTTPRAPQGKRTAKPAPRRKAKRATNGRRRTRNGEGTDDVRAQYEAFHGRPAKGTTEREETELARKDFAKLGKLLDLEVYIDEDRPVLLSFKGVTLCTTGDGGSLYLQGGDQALDLAGLDLERNMPKDYLTVGQVQTIGYRTAKGFHDFEPRDYTHEFGEEGGELPTLNYDTINKLLFLTGGSYQVRPEGITN